MTISYTKFLENNNFIGYENNLITHCKIWSQRTELNCRPTDYESVALPLSYAGFSIRFLLIANSISIHRIKSDYIFSLTFPTLL